jgi:hypothetical protein
VPPDPHPPNISPGINNAAAASTPPPIFTSRPTCKPRPIIAPPGKLDTSWLAMIPPEKRHYERLYQKKSN